MIAYYLISFRKTLYIEKIEHGINDYVVFYVKDELTETKSRKSKSRIQHTAKGQPYFIHYKRKIYLDECIKVRR